MVPRMLAWPFRLSLVLALPLALSAPGCSSSVDDSGAVGDAARDVVGPQPDAGDDSATEDASAARDGPRADANESSTWTPAPMMLPAAPMPIPTPFLPHMQRLHHP